MQNKIWYHPYYKYDIQNFFQIYSVQNDLTPRTADQNKAKSTLRYVMMLLLLCRLLRDTMTFCPFHKIQELMPAKTRHQEQ
jgi:hypothetical protein